MGTGILNWVFAIPAVFTIDRWGRRNLLLFTFPFLAITLLWTGFSFWFHDNKTKVGMVTTGMCKSLPETWNCVTAGIFKKSFRVCRSSFAMLITP
jgi:hypothetical protein